MKALVLGGCGFIGSHVVDALIGGGHEAVIADRNALPKHLATAPVKHLRGDLDAPGLLRAALDGVDVVYHLADSSMPGDAQADPAAAIEQSLIGAVRLLEAMRVSACCRIVYFSSGGAIYGETGNLEITEEQAAEPICSYGIIKLAVEKYLGMYQQLHGFQPTILRVSNAYGPRQGKPGLQGIIATCLHRVLHSEVIDIWGDGLTVRDYVYVEDIARLARIVGEGEPSCGVFHVSSGQGITLDAVLDLVKTVSGMKLSVCRHPARAFDARHVVLSNVRASRRFAWSPQIGLQQGIELSWQYLLDEVSPASAMPQHDRQPQIAIDRQHVTRA